jgi:hypothetical protein
MSIKALIAELFLSKEVAAIKARLAEASAALTKIEAQVVGIAKEAAPEAQKLASDVLTTILSAADDIRVKESGYLHDWEADAYKVYNAGKAVALSAYSHALTLIEKTQVFFK